MPDERPSDVLGSLPRTRPHRRSAKRQARPAPAAEPAPAAAARETAPARPRKTRAKATPTRATKPVPARRKPAAPPPAKANPPLLGTAVQAAAELAEIGLSASARAVRDMLSRLPRP